MDRPSPSMSDSVSDAASDAAPERVVRYDERDDAASVARFDDAPGAAPYADDARSVGAGDAGEVDPADRTAFRIGANLLTLLVLVLGGWWLWRHVLAPALLGSP